ncbi:hypothetical protein MtrunA17_Chr5g0409511 [Medicago truncatula]|uniref:Transmembrane protein n=1 Tax=Medicago truncatula TaxID=3880 RepID=G7K845_MEDTR|nr:hypothetical protein MTR_5g027090 [Medicago truncatula]RHN54681.1 hypothetical protein MtrunA17_Chr5g0409511 [Medicago truncatula]
MMSMLCGMSFFLRSLWDELVEEVKVLSWRWVLGRFNVPACMYYEWCWCPCECLLR